MRRALLPVLVTVSACGGLDNDPLRVGTLRGRVLDADPAVALVSVLGAPERMARVDAAGDFALQDLPAGPVSLLVVGTERSALRVDGDVQPARAVDLGALALRPGGTLGVTASAPGHQRMEGGTVSVDGTPWTAVALDGEGSAEVHPLPRGCWTARLRVPGLGERAAEVCLNEGEEQQVHLELPAPDGSPEREGCAVSGCESGYACQADGACR